MKSQLSVGVVGVGSALVALLTLSSQDARAEVAAVHAAAHGGIDSGGSSAEANTAGSATGFGYRLGARLLIFEGYFDYTTFGQGANVSRGIVGVRGGFGSRDVRLVLRAGGGVIDEEGGALTGRLPGTPSRRGVVGRVGAAIEGRVAPMLLIGFGIDGERFALPGPSGSFSSGTTTGSSVFAKLHLMFELGV